MSAKKVANTFIFIEDKFCKDWNIYVPPGTKELNGEAARRFEIELDRACSIADFQGEASFQKSAKMPSNPLFASLGIHGDGISFYITRVYSKLRRHLDDGAFLRPRRNSRRLRAYVYRARSREEKKIARNASDSSRLIFASTEPTMSPIFGSCVEHTRQRHDFFFNDAIKNYNLHKTIINNGLLFLIVNIL